MPREFVGSRDETRVVVGWAGGRDVQVGVTTPGERSVFWQLLASGDETPDCVDHGRVIRLAESLYALCHEQAGDPEWLLGQTATADDERRRQDVMDELGQRLLNRLDVLSRGTPSGGVREAVLLGSLWCHLEDRESINRLIRLLRRARDGAYGRDA